jgi:KUP system potassium uptake protein
MPDPTTKTSSHVPADSLSALSLAALGVVYGDIGTSPLYTLKIVLEASGDHPGPEAILGALSLIVWTLIIITSVKYITLAMRVDNDGEGGILALTALLLRVSLAASDMLVPSRCAIRSRVLQRPLPGIVYGEVSW